MTSDIDIQAELDMYAALDGKTRRGGCGRSKGNDAYLSDYIKQGADMLGHMAAYKADTAYEIKSRFWFFYADGKWFVDSRVGVHSIATASICCGVHIEAAEAVLKALVDLSMTDETLQNAILKMCRYTSAKTPKGTPKPKPTHTTRQLLQPIWPDLAAQIAAINKAKATPVQAAPAYT